MIVTRYPLFRAFLLFCSGILLANFIDISFGFFLLVLVISGVLSLCFAYFKLVFYTYQNRWLFGLSVSVFFVSLGVVISHLYSEKHFVRHLKILPEKETYAEVELLEEPRKKKRSYGMEVRLLKIGVHKDSLESKSLKFMLYLQKSEKAVALRYGDRLLIQTVINQLQAPQNPHEFDYRDYLNLRAIYAQAYADSSSWQKLSGGNGMKIVEYSSSLRRYLLNVVDSWGLSSTQGAVTKALLLGYRYDIDDNTLKAYASAGAMHVLAVSGLHVGIVYLMTGYMFFFLTRIKNGRVIKSILLVMLLWCFALITGLSASVVRASTMFTFVAVGAGFKRYTSVYNTILASAMFLLCIKPTYLFEVGFQLSYAAVFGIVWMQPQLEELYRPSNKILKWIWGITTVSLAAQLVTFPLGLYYFHQFPTLFLLSNLIVIPLVTCLMYLGVPTLALGAMGINFMPLINLFTSLLWLMNNGVLFVEKQAGFLLTEIHITRFELVALYVLVVSCFWWLVSGGYRRLVLGLLALLCILSSQVWEQYLHHKQKALIVYAIRDHVAIGLYNGGESAFIADSTLLVDNDAMTFHVKHHWWALDVQPTLIGLDTCNSMKRRLLSLDKWLLYMYQDEEECFPEVDLVVVPDVYPARGLRPSSDVMVILSSALNYYQRKKWREWCVRHKVPFHDVSEEGALEFISSGGTR